MGTWTNNRFDSYDSIQLSLTCLSGVDRKMIVPTQKLLDVLAGNEDVAFKESGIPRDSYIFDLRSSVGNVRVDRESLKPLPWLMHDGHRVGGVFCELTPPIDNPGGEISPRSIALKQVSRLKDLFGLTIKSALEAEFMIFEKDARTPFNNVDREAYGRVDNMAGKEHCILEACFSLQKAGLPVETFLTEFAAGQFEMTFRPQEGVASADTIMLMKEGLRASLGKHDLIPTFMAIPNEHGHANGFHLNHSLWTDKGVNEFIDVNDPSKISDTARHWIAGLINHAPALTALLCPTLNCYIRLIDEMTPTKATWLEESRAAYLRLKTERSNIYVENRLPSSACNPYLALAGTLAAGIDGIERKLQCPVQDDPTAPFIPKTLELAVAALEEDTIFIKALGEDFVNAFLSIANKSLTEKTDKQLDNLECQRTIYFYHI